MQKKDFRKMTLRERLLAFPPFLCVALSHKRSTRQTYAQNMVRLWSAKAKKRRWSRIMRGKEPLRRPMWRRMTYEEIAQKCGITTRRVRQVMNYCSWENIPVNTMLALTEACGVSLTHICRYQHRMSQAKKRDKLFTHLTPVQKKHFVKCLKKWKELKESQNS